MTTLAARLKIYEKKNTLASIKRVTAPLFSRFIFVHLKSSANTVQNTLKDAEHTLKHVEQSIQYVKHAVKHVKTCEKNVKTCGTH